MICLVGISDNNAQAHSDTNNNYISISAVGGSIGIQSKTLQYLNGTNPYGLQIDFGTHLFKGDVFNQYSFYPRIGGTLNYWDFNHETLGRGYSATVYIEPFIIARDHFMLSVKGASGLMALTKPYNKTSNPKNTAYSAHWAFPVRLGFGLYLPVTNKWLIKTEGTLHYLSNAGLKLPNDGLFYSTVSLGIEYAFNSYDVPPTRYSKGLKQDRDSREKEWLLATGTGIKQNRDNTNLISVPLIQVQYLSQLTSIDGFTLGTVLENDFSQSGNYPNPIRLSLTAGHLFYISKLRLMQELGYYIYRPGNTPLMLWQRYSLLYRWDNGLTTGLSVKTHYREPEYLGIVIGKSISSKKAGRNTH
jgi:hypothetical protein